MKSSNLSRFITTGALSAAVGPGAFAGNVWVGEQGDNRQEHIVSTKTRAQVLAGYR